MLCTVTLFFWGRWRPHISALFFLAMAGVSMNMNLSQIDNGGWCYDILGCNDESTNLWDKWFNNTFLVHSIMTKQITLLISKRIPCCNSNIHSVWRCPMFFICFLINTNLKMSCVGLHLLLSVFLWGFTTEHQLQDEEWMEMEMNYCLLFMYREKNRSILVNFVSCNDTYNTFSFSERHAEATPGQKKKYMSPPGLTKQTRT